MTTANQAGGEQAGGQDHARLRAADEAAFAQAAAAIRDGRLVAFATETVYGLGADATNAQAVARVFAAKQRPSIDPLIVHVADVEQARRYTTDWPPLAEQLAQAFWPGPLTMVLPKADTVPDIVTSGLPHVGLRVPSHPIARRLIEVSGRPIAAPSANRFGRISPTRAAHVIAELGDEPDLAMVLDGGACEHGVESTVVRLDAGVEPVIHVLRLGGLTIEALSAHGEVRVIEAEHPEASATGLASPGMLSRHYAPATGMSVAADTAALCSKLKACRGGRVGVLALNREAVGDVTLPAGAVLQVLSPSGDLVEAAANLFQTMRAMDTMGFEVMVALKLPQRGLGRAMNDRLQRASRKS